MQEEAGITDLKQLRANPIADLKAVIVELADCHGAEIDRMIENHQAEMQRLTYLHHQDANTQQKQVHRTAKLEAESKIMIIDVISAPSGRT